MQSSYEFTSEPPVDPLAPLAELVGSLVSTTLHLAIGVVLGLIAARVMRHVHLRWTWSVAAVAFAVVAHSALLGWATTLGTAALCSALRGRRWHREDLMAGGDLAEIACERYGPLDAVRALARDAQARLRARKHACAPRDWFHGNRLIVGGDQRGEPVTIPLGGPKGGAHTLVVGAAGSGKTVTQTWVLVRAIERGFGAIVVDPKQDRDMREALAQAASAAGRRFIEWTPDGPSVYNPYADGTPSEIADKALAGERFTEPHYLRQAQRYLGHEVRVLRKAGVQLSLAELVRYLEPERLEQLARNLPEQEAGRTYEYLDALTARQRSDLSGVRDRLAIMAESDFAPWLDPCTPGAPRFDVLDALCSSAVVYFGLESDSRPLLAQMLGTAIVLDLQTASSALQNRPVPAVVAIDEFSAIPTERVASLFARARAAGINLVLGTQELADLRVPGREGVHDQVFGNLSTLIAHRQVVQQSAETVSSLAGAVGAWSTSHHSDGRWTRTRRYVPLIEPDVMRGLGPGWAVVVTFGEERSARIARIFSPRGGAR
jgi:type IV secretory pathway TraG/TraD family ATPase VirD4